MDFLSYFKEATEEESDASMHNIIKTTHIDNGAQSTTMLLVSYTSRDTWSIDYFSLSPYDSPIYLIEFRTLEELLDNEDAIKRKLVFENSEAFWETTFNRLRTLNKIITGAELNGYGRFYNATP